MFVGLNCETIEQFLLLLFKLEISKCNFFLYDEAGKEINSSSVQERQ